MKIGQKLPPTDDYKNLQESIRYYNLSASLGNDSAIFELTRIYEDGDGVPQDLAESYKWSLLNETTHFTMHEVTPELIAEAETRADRWREENPTGWEMILQQKAKDKAAGVF